MIAPARPFTSSLRARPDAIRLGNDGSAAISTVRVQIPEVWDAVRVETPLANRVAELKSRSLDALLPDELPEEFVVKLNGFEVLDENISLEEAGARDGSIFLVTYRRRRAIR